MNNSNGISKTSYLTFRMRSARDRISNLHVPMANLVTYYAANEDIGRFVSNEPSGHDLKIISTSGKIINTSEGTIPYLEHFNGRARTEDDVKRADDLVEMHVQSMKTLDERLSSLPKRDTTGEFHCEDDNPFLVTISENNGFYTLETHLRAPKYFLPNGFVFDDKQYAEVSVVSSMKKTPNGYDKSSNILDSDGSVISTHFEIFENDQLLDLHTKLLREIINRSNFQEGDRDYFEVGETELFLNHFSGDMTRIGYWNSKTDQLNESADKIATAVGNSPHADRIKGIILYGSLARRDKIPDDIDLLLLVESDEKILNPFNYFRVDDKGCPIKYNVWNVTDGIGDELGIMPDLLSIGTKRKSLHGDKYPDKVRYIDFAEDGGKLNLSIITTDFLQSSDVREKYMRLAFNPTYFRDVLTDGLLFDPSSKTFSTPTREVFSEIIDSLEDQLKMARIEHWPNINNKRPGKKR